MLNHIYLLVPERGVEPPWSFMLHTILSRTRKPFRHSGLGSIISKLEFYYLIQRYVAATVKTWVRRPKKGGAFI